MTVSSWRVPEYGADHSEACAGHNALEHEGAGAR